MRMIGHLEDETKARAFSDYLYVQKIDNQVEPDKGNSWAIWIHAEEELERAKGLLASYRENPTDPKFQSTARAANDLREQKKKEQSDYEKRLKRRRHLFRPMTAYGVGMVTFALIAICVVVFLISWSPEGLKVARIHALFISEQDIPEAEGIRGWDGVLTRISHIKEALPEVRQGEIWRLLTPMFIHMSIIHIFFNMIWLRDLGSMVEARQNGGKLLILILVFGAVSNLAQYFVDGPGFGGMSGVVYGLVGYIWIRGKLDPGSGLYLHPSTVTMMIVWFFVCLAGVMGPVANTAHAAGLLTGMTWGFLSSLRHR